MNAETFLISIFYYYCPYIYDLVLGHMVFMAESNCFSSCLRHFKSFLDGICSVLTAEESKESISIIQVSKHIFRGSRNIINDWDHVNLKTVELIVKFSKWSICSNMWRGDDQTHLMS